MRRDTPLSSRPIDSRNSRRLLEGVEFGYLGFGLCGNDKKLCVLSFDSFSDSLHVGIA